MARPRHITVANDQLYFDRTSFFRNAPRPTTVPTTTTTTTTTPATGSNTKLPSRGNSFLNAEGERDLRGLIPRGRRLPPGARSSTAALLMSDPHSSQSVVQRHQSDGGLRRQKRSLPTPVTPSGLYLRALGDSQVTKKKRGPATLGSSTRGNHGSHTDPEEVYNVPDDDDDYDEQQEAEDDVAEDQSSSGDSTFGSEDPDSTLIMPGARVYSHGFKETKLTTGINTGQGLKLAQTLVPSKAPERTTANPVPAASSSSTSSALTPKKLTAGAKALKAYIETEMDPHLLRVDPVDHSVILRDQRLPQTSMEGLLVSMTLLSTFLPSEGRVLRVLQEFAPARILKLLHGSKKKSKAAPQQQRGNANFRHTAQGVPQATPLSKPKNLMVRPQPKVKERHITSSALDGSIQTPTLSVASVRQGFKESGASTRAPGARGLVAKPLVHRPFRPKERSMAVQQKKKKKVATARKPWYRF